MVSKRSRTKVLVLDGDMPHSVAIVRSLGRQGVQVDVAAYHSAPLAGYSRHVSQILHYANPLCDEIDFVSTINQWQLQHHYDLVIPVTERSMVALHKHRASLEDISRIAMPDQNSLEVALDKQKTFQLAESLNIPVPRGNVIEQGDPIDHVPTTITFPAVLKPGRSVAAGGGTAKQISVDYALDAAEFMPKARDLCQHGSLIVQEYFRGDGIGIEVLAAHGDVIYAFQHKRLHELPLTGGGSTLRQSVDIDSVLLDASARLLKALQWHGVAMVEFKHDAGTGEYRLMEINGRFWGSLPLAIASGADFPRLLLALYQDDLAADSLPHYQRGVICRRLDNDLLWTETVLRGADTRGLVEVPDKKEALKTLVSMFGRNQYFDVQSLADIKPGLVDLGRIAGTYAERLTSLAADKLERFRHGRAGKRKQLVKALKSSKSILFVCYGNINRSALAEYVFLAKAAEGYCSVASAGFHEAEGRPADPQMQKASRLKGIDLGPSASSILDRDMLQGADVVLVMEVSHIKQIEQQYPDQCHKVFLLGLMKQQAGADNCEIADPYGKVSKAYENCFNEISDSIGNIVSIREDNL
ncbi:hypothetical protein EYC98_10605 [Halieaceae bacterium IMCC14734]|uniref:protein-tyrosine-phosphatase n=1 Tax=Candidatus Litorirhabdus singularis TaxID=2518993 RepID=A0ABT3TIS8_9GAMM|nr:ATP-grasp domain-containing protein [Candidatus Litorirhabdus singularis]MCX2981314.1 hypothetical protein [Candidatus Litorirhabdus singularis]